MGHYYAEMACPKCGSCRCVCEYDENDPLHKKAHEITQKYREEQLKLTNAWLTAIRSKLARA